MNKPGNPVNDKCLSPSPNRPTPSPEPLYERTQLVKKVNQTTYIPVYTITSRLPFTCYSRINRNKVQKSKIPRGVFIPMFVCDFIPSSDDFSHVGLSFSVTLCNVDTRHGQMCTNTSKYFSEHFFFCSGFLLSRVSRSV